MTGTEARTAPLDRATLEVVCLLVFSNVVANLLLDGGWYVPWNLAMAAAVLGVARRRGGVSNESLAIEPAALRDGLRWGLTAGGAIAAVVLVAALLPRAGDAFADDRGRITGAELAWKVFVTIPLGTAVLEEVAFRGALPALLGQHPGWSHRRAVVASATLFGLWHVLPSLELGAQNDALAGRLQGRSASLAAVAGSVAVTALAGLGFSWLRDRSRSLLAPVLAHVAVNASAAVAAWATTRP